MTRVRPRAKCLALGALAFVASQLAPHRAHAADPPPASPPAASSPATAEQLAGEAYQQHTAGHYAEAIAKYLEAYEISKAGVILFNVATIYDRRLRERELAEDYYRRYLGAPDAEPELVKKANDRLTALKKEDADAASAAKAASVAPLPSTAPAPPPAAAPAPAPASSPASSPAEAPRDASSPGRPLRTAGIVVGAVGIAGVGASLVLGLVAKGKNDDANAICNGAACSSDRGVSLAKDAGTFATASTVAFVTGLVLVGGGVTMYLVAPRDTSASSTSSASASPSVTLGPLFGATSAGMSVRGSF
jgi:hypothetical protein